MAKNKAAKPLGSTTKSGEILTPKEELFCLSYILFKGNGTEAAMEAYDCDTRNSAGVKANGLLRKDKIIERINELVDKHIMTEAEADFELTKVIRQEADLKAKRGGISDYNKMKGRYEKDNEQKRPLVIPIIDVHKDNSDA